MKLACIHGCFNRAFDAGTMDQTSVLGRCATTLGIQGVYVDGWPSVERTAHLAVHVHAKFWQVAPDGTEPTIDYPKLVAMLRRRGYAGWISFESEAAEAEATRIPRALAYLRRLLGASLGDSGRD